MSVTPFSGRSSPGAMVLPLSTTLVGVQKPLPSVEKINRLNYEQNKAFIKVCTQHYVNHTYRYSTEPLSYEMEDFFNWLQAEELFVMTKDNRKLGYIVLHQNDTVDSILVSYSFFIHPRICKLNSVHLASGGLALAATYSTLQRARSITTYVNHTLLLNSINGIFPTQHLRLQEGILFVSMYLLGLSSTEIKETLVEHFIPEQLEQYYEVF